MLQEIEWPPLEERRKHARLGLLYKVTHDQVAVPQKYHLVMKEGSTRSCTEGHYNIIACRTDAFKYSILPLTTVEFNGLPLEVKVAPSVDAFWASIKSL